MTATRGTESRPCLPVPTGAIRAVAVIAVDVDLDVAARGGAAVERIGQHRPYLAIASKSA